MSSSKRKECHESYKCKLCTSSFNRKYNLLKHMRRSHGSDMYIMPSEQVSIDHKTVCSICSALTPRLSSLREHMDTAHNIKSVKLLIEFSSFEEFIKWKENYESKNNCSYVVKSSPKKLANEVKRYYYCKELCSVCCTIKGNEMPKSTLCTSSMELSTRKNQHILSFWPVHIGHASDSGNQFSIDQYGGQNEETSEERTTDQRKLSSISENKETVMCHVCLSSEGVMKAMDDATHNLTNFTKFFCELTSLRIDIINTTANYKICEKCTRRVMDAHNFRETALASNSHLRTNSLSANEVPVEEEVKKDDKREKQKIKLLSEKYVCSECNKTFQYKSEMQRHKQSHNGALECSICSKKFGFKSSLLRHIQQHSRGRSKSVRCVECRSVFLDQALLKRHIAYAHRVKKHACDQCGAVFGTRTALTNHVKIHAEKQLSCRFCSKKFTYRHQLKRHETIHAEKIATSSGKLNEGNDAPCKWCHEKLNSKYIKKHELVCKRQANIHSNNKSTVFYPITNNTLQQKLDKTNNNDDLKDTAKIVEEVESMMNDQFESGFVNNTICKNTVLNIEDANIKCKNCSCDNVSSEPNTNSESVDFTNAKTTKVILPPNDVDTVKQISNATKGNDCKGFLGKCILENNKEEECICAKVSYEAPLPEYLTTPLLAALEQQGYYPS